MKQVCTLKLLCNLSRKKSREVAASLPGRFRSRRCFTPCITMEVEPRIAKQYKCCYCCSCKNYRGKGVEGGEKVSLRRFLAGREFVGEGGGGGGQCTKEKDSRTPEYWISKPTPNQRRQGNRLGQISSYGGGGEKKKKFWGIL